jgi:tRNA-splicing ligase RtcB
MLAFAFNVSADCLSDPARAGQLLADLGKAVPALRRHRSRLIAPPGDLAAMPLSHASLEAVRHSEGSLQLGTVGSGNHFVELQADELERLWLMVHSGSRSMGQAIRDHHVARASPVGQGLRALDAASAAGQAYAQDVTWARRYAQANRLAIAAAVASVLATRTAAQAQWNTLVHIDHNHIARERHGDQWVWVHRKGAMPAAAGMAGLLPGSMGTASFHVEGRGCAASLCSSAHGAGRSMSRHVAARSITDRELHQQMQGIWYDFRHARSLREEAPAAYKNIRAVLRAQHDLVKVTRTLRPVLNYKGS